MPGRTAPPGWTAAAGTGGRRRLASMRPSSATGSRPAPGRRSGAGWGSQGPSRRPRFPGRRGRPVMCAGGCGAAPWASHAWGWAAGRRGSGRGSGGPRTRRHRRGGVGGRAAALPAAGELHPPPHRVVRPASRGPPGHAQPPPSLPVLYPPLTRCTPFTALLPPGRPQPSALPPARLTSPTTLHLGRQPVVQPCQPSCAGEVVVAWG